MIRGLAVLVGAVIVLGGCSSSLKKENALYVEENENLRQQLGDLNRTLDDAYEQVREKDRRIAELEGQMAAAPEGGLTGFEDIPGVVGSMRPGEITATVESDVLFDSGQATLKSAAKRSLDAVASVLSERYGGYPIRVEGHTDTDPIRKSGHKSNHHLGFERAFAVREYLKSRGVGAERLSLSSFGPDRPAGTKPQSRRVEIVVITGR